ISLGRNFGSCSLGNVDSGVVLGQVNPGVAAARRSARSLSLAALAPRGLTWPPCDLLGFALAIPRGRKDTFNVSQDLSGCASASFGSSSVARSHRKTRSQSPQSNASGV